jgi:hypothetical protein
MATNSSVPASAVVQSLNLTTSDPKSAMRLSQNRIKELLNELGDPNKPLNIDGKLFYGTDKFSASTSLFLSNKMEELNNQTTSILSIFNELFRIEKSISGS